jgi:DNA-binding transcriptional regulator of glucitol operon
MDIRGMMVALIIVLIIMALIRGALGWPEWTIFVGTGIIIIPLLFFAMKR